MLESKMLDVGTLLTSHDIENEPGLWFIFYADDEGVVAFDITREHPDIGYTGFAAAMNFDDPNPATEKVVLLGGPERHDDGLIILHEAHASTADSMPINDQFAMMSYNYVRVPGKPPALTTPDNRPTQIRLKQSSGFIIAMGYRIFDAPSLQRELRQGSWICIPAATDVIFNTRRRDRRAKMLQKMN